MAALSAHALLDVWTHGRGLHPIDQALALLAAAEPEIPSAEHATLSLGERNSRLFALREAIFGSRIAAVAACPHCGERLELSLSTTDLREQSEASAPEACEIEIDGRHQPVRPLTSIDLAAIAGCDDVDRARFILAARCLADAQQELSGLLPAAVDALSECLARCDPQAEALLEMLCPGCGLSAHVGFDIASFLWGELAAEARRLAQEVDALARRYGWREADILALGSARRQLYLEMAV